MARPQAFPAHIFEMMMRLGIDPRRLDIPALRPLCTAAVAQCDGCRFKPACEDWLDHAPQPVKSAPWFCINADNLSDLQCDQARLPADRLRRPARRGHGLRRRGAAADLRR